MADRRLVFGLILLFIKSHLTISTHCDIYSRHEDIPFNLKVQQTPIIVIGTSLNKNFDLNVPNLFNVTFLVRCVLKGSPTSRLISIVQAGSLLGRRACQRFDVHRDYIAFLEPFFDNTFRPVDLEEVTYTDQVNLLLEKTCGLSRTYPFTEPNDVSALLTNKCPPHVSVDCPSATPKNFIKTSAPIIDPISTTEATTTNQPSSRPRTTDPFVFSRSTIDFDLLSMMLAEHQYPNRNDDVPEAQHPRSLFSDDEARRNQAMRMPCMITIRFISLIICSILIFFFVE